MMKHAKTKFQWRLTLASSALSAAAVTKGELKARPSRPLRGPRLALHSQPAAAAHRVRCETPPRPLAGKLLIGSLRSTICSSSGNVLFHLKVARAAALPSVVGALAVLCGGPALAADAERGGVLYEARCGACHSLDAHRVGPMHRGVFGRRAGSAPGYDYSAALKGASMTWDAASLDAWLKNPEALVPGQRMGYSVPDATDRDDLVAFLRRAATP